MAGHRGYCLIDDGLLLNMALVNYGLHFLRKKGYTLCQPPYFMLRDQMAKTAQLEQFDEELYKVTGDGDNDTDKYLIATSEQPISAMHAGEWMQEKELPIKYVRGGLNGCSSVLNVFQVLWVQHKLQERSGLARERCLGCFPCSSV